MTIKRCVVCRREYEARRKDKRHCEVGCRMRSYRLRQGAGVRQPRTKGGRSEKVNPLFGVAGTALAVASITQKLERERAEREKAVAALEATQKTLADLHTDTARQRVEFDEKVAYERAAHDKERAALRVMYERELEKEEKLYKRWLKEVADEAAERQRAALREEQAKAHKALGMVYEQLRDLRFERARAEDQKRLAQAQNAELRKQREDLSERLAEATQRSQWLLLGKEDLNRMLDDEIKSGDQQEVEHERLRGLLGQVTEEYCRLEATEQTARKHLVAGAESYEALRRRFNTLVVNYNALATTADTQYEDLCFKFNTLVEEFNGQLTNYNVLVGKHNHRLTEYNALIDRFNALRNTEHEKYEALRLKHNTLVGQYNGLLAAPPPGSAWPSSSRQLAAENVRLVTERDWLKKQLAQKSAAAASLEATVNQQQQALAGISVQGTLSDTQTHQDSARRHRTRLPKPEGPERSNAESVRIMLESQEAPGSLWHSILKFCGGAALGGAAAAAGLKALVSSARNDKALSGASQPTNRRLKEPDG